MNLKEKIIRYLSNQGESEEEIAEDFSCTVNIAMSLAYYAHRKQQRENGTPYFFHPLRVCNLYRRFVGITNDFFCIDVDLMYEHEIPFEGVQEVCLMHDVSEDTEITVKEIRELFSNEGYESYFDLYIRAPLLAVTHHKKPYESYESYIRRVLQNRAAALVKMMDLIDNCNPLDLTSWSEKELNRTLRYVGYIDVIEKKYRFLERAHAYRAKKALCDKEDLQNKSENEE